MRDIIERWDWKLAPAAPLGWTDAEKRVVLVEGWLADEIADPALVSTLAQYSQAKQDMLWDGLDAPAAPDGIPAHHHPDILPQGIVGVLVETAETWQRISAAGRSFASPLAIPALRIERQADLSPAALRALLHQVKAPHRALVVSPREALDLGAALHLRACPHHPAERAGWDGVVPCDCREHQATACGCHGHQKVRADLVIVDGPTGPDAWPMHPRWVRSVRDDCAAAGVAFMMAGWGEWVPTVAPRLLDPNLRDFTDRRLVHRGGNAAAATAGDIMRATEEPWCGAERVGAARAGRRLDGVEHLALPEGL